MSHNDGRSNFVILAGNTPALNTTCKQRTPKLEARYSMVRKGNTQKNCPVCIVSFLCWFACLKQNGICVQQMRREWNTIYFFKPKDMLVCFYKQANHLCVIYTRIVNVVVCNESLLFLVLRSLKVFTFKSLRSFKNTSSKVIFWVI